MNSAKLDCDDGIKGLLIAGSGDRGTFGGAAATAEGYFTNQIINKNIRVQDNTGTLLVAVEVVSGLLAPVKY